MTKSEAKSYLYNKVFTETNANFDGEITEKEYVSWDEVSNTPDVTGITQSNDTLFIDTDIDLKDINRIEVKGKDNLGLEFYVDKDTYWHTGSPSEEDADYLVAEKDNSWEITSLTICTWNKKKKAFQYWSEYNDCDAYIYPSDNVKWHIVPSAWEEEEKE